MAAVNGAREREGEAATVRSIRVSLTVPVASVCRAARRLAYAYCFSRFLSPLLSSLSSFSLSFSLPLFRTHAARPEYASTNISRVAVFAFTCRRCSVKFFFFSPSPIFSPLNHARQKNPTRNSRSSYTRIPFAVYNNERAPCRFEFNREPVIDAYACVHELAVRRDTVTRCVKFPEKESVARSERRREKERETARLLDGFLNQTIDTELDWKLRNNRCG